jgi:hypothetical protein
VARRTRLGHGATGGIYRCCARSALGSAASLQSVLLKNRWSAGFDLVRMALQAEFSDALEDDDPRISHCLRYTRDEQVIVLRRN